MSEWQPSEISGRRISFANNAFENCSVWVADRENPDEDYKILFVKGERETHVRLSVPAMEALIALVEGTSLAEVVKISPRLKWVIVKNNSVKEEGL